MNLLQSSPSDLIKFVIKEIALEGLEGCRLDSLFHLLLKTADTTTGSLALDVNCVSSQLKTFFLSAFPLFNENKKELINYQNFIWRLVQNRRELDFYILDKPDERNNNSLIISSAQCRGLCKNFYNRSCVNSLIKGNKEITYQSLLEKLVLF
jgi:hypothetical protein